MKHPLFKGAGGTTVAERNVRAILSTAIKASGKKRDAIAAEMSEELGRDVTGSMIGDFTRGASKNRSVRFPAAWVPAFCNATGSDTLLRFLLSPEMTAALELGEWDMKHLKRDRQPRKRQTALSHKMNGGIIR